MSLADFQIPQPAGLPGAINSVIGALKTASLASGTFLIPAGGYLMLPVANCILEIQDPATTWSTVYGVSTGGFFISDGTNFRIRTTATVSYKLYPLPTDRLYSTPSGVTGTVGSYMGAAVTAALTVGQTFVIAQGAWVVMPVANITLEIQDPVTTWTVVFASAVGGFMVSDGTNMRIKATGSGTYKLYRYQ